MPASYGASTLHKICTEAVRAQEGVKDSTGALLSHQLHLLESGLVKPAQAMRFLRDLPNVRSLRGDDLDQLYRLVDNLLRVPNEAGTKAPAQQLNLDI